MVRQREEGGRSSPDAVWLSDKGVHLRDSGVWVRGDWNLLQEERRKEERREAIQGRRERQWWPLEEEGEVALPHARGLH